MIGIYLLALVPIIEFECRSTIFYHICKVKTEPFFLFHIFNIFYVGVILIIYLAKVSLTIILSLTGAIISLFIVFLIPIIMHLKSLQNC